MPIVHKLTDEVKIVAERKVLVVEDITGLYGATTYIKQGDEYLAKLNTTGYGGDNTERHHISLFLLAHIKTMKGDIRVDVLPYNPTTVTKFEIKYTQDGWYKVELLAFPIDLNPIAGNYMEGSVVSTGSSIVILEKGNWIPTEPIDYRDSRFAVASANIPIVLNTADVKRKLNMKMEQLKFHDDVTSYELKETEAKYNRIRCLLEAACYQFTSGNHYVFQKSMEHLIHNHC